MKQNRKYILLAVILCCMAASATGICWNSVGVFYTPVSESLGVMRGTFAMHSTVATIATAIGSLFVGKIIHRVKLRPILVTGMLMAGLSTIAMGFSRTMIAFYILGIIRGVGCSLFGNLIITMVVVRWFHQKCGLMTSIVMASCGIAGGLFSPIFTACIERFGWEMSYVIMGACVIVVALPMFLLNFTLVPQDCGHLPYGYEEKTAEVKAEAAENTGEFVGAIFIAMMIFSTILPLITGIAQHFAGFAEAIGLTASIGATMVSASMIGNIGTKLVFGSISDKFGVVKATVIMTVINMIALMIILVGGNKASIPMLMGGSVAFGSVYAVAAVALSLLTRHFFGSEQYGRIFPYVTFVSNIGSAASLTLTGYVYDFTGAYDFVFIGAVGIQVLCLLLLAFMVISRKRKTLP